MKINSVFLLFFFGFVGLGAGLHEYYVGITEISYSKASETYQITLKLFTDDLENAILKNSGDSLNLGVADENTNSDWIIFTYLDKHFSLKSPESGKLKLNRVGRETELDITWIYYESEKLEPVKALNITNSIFMEMHPEQTHIVNLEQGGNTKSILLHSSKTEGLLKL